MSIKINGKSLVKGQINGKEINKIVINGNVVYTSEQPFNLEYYNHNGYMISSTSKSISLAFTDHSPAKNILIWYVIVGDTASFANWSTNYTIGNGFTALAGDGIRYYAQKANCTTPETFSLSLTQSRRGLYGFYMVMNKVVKNITTINGGITSSKVLNKGIYVIRAINAGANAKAGDASIVTGQNNVNIYVNNYSIRYLVYSNYYTAANISVIEVLEDNTTVNCSSAADKSMEYIEV